MHPHDGAAGSSARRARPHVSQQFHAYLKEQGIPHVWHVNPGGHNGETWKLDLYHFSQLLFRAPPPAPGDAQGK